MKKFLTDILADPITGKTLLYDAGKNILFSDDENLYKILNDVPLLLPKVFVQVTSPLHQNLLTGFNYADHYQEDAVAYDYFSEDDSRATKNEIRRLHQAVINAVPAKADVILDAGCGNAWLAKHFLKRNKKIISMDISSINPIRALQENPRENHVALVGDVFNLPIKNNSVDCIVAAEIMEHVYEPALFIDKLVEKIKPGGKLIITTPYNEKIEYYLCVHCNKPTPKNAHLHSFNKQNINILFSGKALRWSGTSFANKYLIRTRINLLVSFLPFGLWKFFDKMINFIFNSPTRLLIEIIKI